MVSPTKAPTKSLLSEFDNLHRATLGTPAHLIGAKDAKLLADLYQRHGDDVVALMRDFFADGSESARAYGYTVGVFYKQFARLLAQRAARAGTLGPAKPDRPRTRSDRNMAAVREVLGL